MQALSLQYRCVLFMSTCGAAGFLDTVASKHPSSLTVQPFPLVFQKSAFGIWLWCITDAWHIALKTHWLKASSVGWGLCHWRISHGCQNVSALIKGSAWTSILCSFLSMEKMEWAYFLATGSASSIVDNPMFYISFTSLRRVFGFAKTVVFPFLTYSADTCSVTASESMTCR